MNAAPRIVLSGSGSVGGTVLFGPLTLDLPAGRWSCLLGGSGVGKTTLLRLIAGLSTGVAFDGTVQAEDGAPVLPRVAYMAQQGVLMPWATVRQNVILGARLRGEAPDLARAEAALRAVGLSAHAGKRPAALSGGQQQRVALARVLMEDRPLVLLDEPFSALDARTRSEMQDLTVETLRGKTVLLVTHDPGEAARLGDQILVMSDAGLRAISPPASKTPRDETSSETLACQAHLLRLLKETP